MKQKSLNLVLVIPSISAILTSTFVFCAEKCASTHLPLIRESFSLVEEGSLTDPQGVPFIKNPMKQLGHYGQADSHSVVCGPTAERNVARCFDLHKKTTLGFYPIPGSITANPVFHKGYWYLGTSQGFFFKVKENALGAPSLGKEELALWGANSRKMTSLLRPKPLIENEIQEIPKPMTVSLSGKSEKIPWMNHFFSEFVGEPVFYKEQVSILTLNQYLHTFSLTDGKLLWSVRLSPDNGKLKVASTSLTTDGINVFVGSDAGAVSALEGETGKVLWTKLIPSLSSKEKASEGIASGQDRFLSINASPLVVEKGLFASNMESQSYFLSRDKGEILWTYSEGSITSADKYGHDVFVVTANGNAVRIDSRTGSVIWKSEILNAQPLVAVTYILHQKHQTLLVASKNGDIFLISAKNGKILSKIIKTGSLIEGKFFSTSQNEYCLNYLHLGFKCFKVYPDFIQVYKEI